MTHSGKRTALMIASVGTMIDSFNRDNIRLLSGLGYEVHVAANFVEGNPSISRMEKFRQELEQQGVNSFHIPMPRNPYKFGRIITSYKMVKKLVEEHQYDIVHCHSPVGGVVARLACRKARKNGTKVLYTAHGFHFFKGASKTAWLVYYPIEKMCSYFTDVLITINQEDHQRAAGLHAKQNVYIPGVGVNTQEFRKIEINTAKKRAQLGIAEGDFLFISVGELSHRKNHETAIRALAKIEDSTCKYLIAGTGPLDSQLKQLVDKLGLKERVIFAGYRSDIKELLHASNAFVFPSIQEGLPVALMEAMAVGLPVVCSRIRGNVDLVENGQGGYLYAPMDVDGFAEGMKKLVHNELSSMGMVNMELMEKFDIRTVNTEMEKIYRSVATN